MYEVQNKLAPACIQNLFAHVSDIHSYNTKWSATTNKFCVMSSRLERLKNSFSRFGVRLWNALPGNIKKSASRNLLKKQTAWNSLNKSILHFTSSSILEIIKNCSNPEKLCNFDKY